MSTTVREKVNDALEVVLVVACFTGTLIDTSWTNTLLFCVLLNLMQIKWRMK